MALSSSVEYKLLIFNVTGTNDLSFTFYYSVVFWFASVNCVPI
uniref:Uncharacterized protein n=1 Tax=Arundo donax TaxID=35708 RepID=A0A0A9GL99_ARUDO